MSISKIPWEPDLSNREDAWGSGNYLQRAKEIWIQQTHQQLIMEIVNKKGTIAFEFPGSILSARARLYGNITSCDIRLLYHARDCHKQLVLYIGEAGAFYAFNPSEILAIPDATNLKGDETWKNFPISLGWRVPK